MERLCQSLADAAKDETKKKDKTARVLREPMVGERERGMRTAHGVGRVLNDTSAVEGGRLYLADQIPGMDICTDIP